MKFYLFLHIESIVRIARLSVFIGIYLLAGSCEPELNEFDYRIDGLSVDQFFERIPPLDEPSPVFSESESRLSNERAADGGELSCHITTVQRVELLDTLTVPAFNNLSATEDKALYPGSLLFVKDLRDAYRLKALDSIQRSPLNIISSSAEGIAVNNPLFRENVDEAIQEISSGNNASTIDYEIAEMHSLDQALLDVNINRSSLSNQNIEMLQVAPGIDEKAVLIKFVQTYYKIKVAEQLRPSGYFANSVTVEDLEAQVSSDDPVGLIEEVLYGRIILGKLTYRGSLFSAKDSLSAAVNRAFTMALQGESSSESPKFADASFEALILGGTTLEATSLTNENGIDGMVNAYRHLLQGRNNTQLGVPIQFKVRYLSNQEPFRIGDETNYQTFDCLRVPIGVKVKRLILRSFPHQDENGSVWDDNVSVQESLPDIFPAISKSSIYQEFYQDLAFINIAKEELPRMYTHLDGRPIEFSVFELSKHFQIEFWDRDEEEEKNQFMGKIRIAWENYGVRSEDPIPNWINLSDDDFEIRMNVEWLYN